MSSLQGQIPKLPKVQKKPDDLSVFFVLLGSAHVKAAHILLMKLTPGGAKIPRLARVYIKHHNKDLLCMVIKSKKLMVHFASAN